MEPEKGVLGLLENGYDSNVENGAGIIAALQVS